jgi:hypothetical protein
MGFLVSAFLGSGCAAISQRALISLAYLCGLTADSPRNADSGFFGQGHPNIGKAVKGSTRIFHAIHSSCVASYHWLQGPFVERDP